MKQKHEVQSVNQILGAGPSGSQSTEPARPGPAHKKEAGAFDFRDCWKEERYENGEDLLNTDLMIADFLLEYQKLMEGMLKEIFGWRPLPNPEALYVLVDAASHLAISAGVPREEFSLMASFCYDEVKHFGPSCSEWLKYINPPRRVHETTDEVCSQEDTHGELPSDATDTEDACSITDL